LKQIKYTPESVDKLCGINRAVSARYGSKKAKEIIEKITGAIRGLADNEQKSPSVRNMFGVMADYRCIFVPSNYVFYTVEDYCIKIINIYNEKEDFMWLLFGLDTASQETIDYWNE